MSQQYRSPHRTIQDKTGSGCALILIVVGIGITILAVGVGLVLAVFTIDAVEIETIAPGTVVTEIDVHSATTAPTSGPAAVSSPTPHSTATPVPLTSESTGSPESQNTSADDAYAVAASTAIEELQGSLDSYLELMGEVDSLNPDWRASFEAELELWESTFEQVQAMNPPEHHSASYASLYEASELLSGAAEQVRTGVLSDNPLAFIAGVERAAESMSHLFDARLFLQRETEP